MSVCLLASRGGRTGEISAVRLVCGFPLAGRPGPKLSFLLSELSQRPAPNPTPAWRACRVALSHVTCYVSRVMGTAPHAHRGHPGSYVLSWPPPRPLWPVHIPSPGLHPKVSPRAGSARSPFPRCGSPSNPLSALWGSSWNPNAGQWGLGYGLGAGRAVAERRWGFEAHGPGTLSWEDFSVGTWLHPHSD